MEAVKTVLSTDQISTYLAKTGALPDDVATARRLEQSVIGMEDSWYKQRKTIVYELAFFLSGEKRLDLGLPDGTVFTSVDQMKEYLARIGLRDIKELYQACGYILEDSLHMKPKVYGWLKQQGCQLEAFNR